jgi:threonine 3-dehydrogenase
LIFIPSTIATFGPKLEKNTGSVNFQQNPITYYGISKLHIEKLGSYYHKNFNTDFRCLRYPPIISPYEIDSNGPASYASEVIHSLLKSQPYTIYIDPEISLSMMYIKDCVRATIELIEAGNSYLTTRVYNINGFSLSAKQFMKELKKSIQINNIDYKIDNTKNEIAKSWTVNLDDDLSIKDWGWKPQILNTKKLMEALLMEIAELYRK